jgi:hypothetical protein
MRYESFTAQAAIASISSRRSRRMRVNGIGLRIEVHHREQPDAHTDEREKYQDLLALEHGGLLTQGSHQEAMETCG